MESIALCKKVGQMYRIPGDQMRFELMFDKDHPNVHG
jgi:hypothetical protein